MGVMGSAIDRLGKKGDQDPAEGRDAMTDPEKLLAGLQETFRSNHKPEFPTV
jgi:hypothetical protein